MDTWEAEMKLEGAVGRKEKEGERGGEGTQHMCLLKGGHERALSPVSTGEPGEDWGRK